MPPRAASGSCSGGRTQDGSLAASSCRFLAAPGPRSVRAPRTLSTAAGFSSDPLSNHAARSCLPAQVGERSRDVLGRPEGLLGKPLCVAPLAAGVAQVVHKRVIVRCLVLPRLYGLL